MTAILEASKYLKPPLISLGAVFDVLKSEQLLVGSADTHFNKEVYGPLVIDSRCAVPHSVYIAIRGQSSDGHDFIEDALKSGASLVIGEASAKTLSLRNAPYLQVNSSREAWAWLCAAAWDHPQRKLNLLGVTGTNGKTSTVWMLKALCEAMGETCATIGTLGFYVKDSFVPTTHTTPDPNVLFGLIQLAVDQGAKILAMEVASHSLFQKKVSPLKFAGAAFTSFSQDHLDLHKTMENYLATKLELFQKHLKPGASVVIHEDVFPLIKLALPSAGELQLSIYGASEGSAVHVHSEPGVKRGHTAVEVKGDDWDFAGELPFIGNIFAENFAAALTLARSCCSGPFPGDGFSAMLTSHLLPVPGRMMPLASRHRGRPLVLVDYAHTPDALEKSLEVARQTTSRRLICVFGCGGDRDRTKRPLMGKIAGRLSDVVVVTSDNPRTEDLEAIISEILSGLDANRPGLVIESDRRKAIAAAVLGGVSGDTVLIAGKGHENYQVLGRESLPFSDREEAERALNQKKNWCVIGSGVSGEASSALLRSQGDDVLVSDAAKVSDSVKAKYLTLGARLFDGGHDESHLDNIQAAVLSPGVSASNSLLKLAREKNLGICTEIDLGLENFKGTLVAVTGTNGKSTTCAMLEHLLRTLGKTASACGNIGLPPSALPAELKTPESTLVCELSSYQLEHSLPVLAEVAVFTSFSFDHIARHGSLRRYFECKWAITHGLRPSGLLLLRGDAFKQALTFELDFPSARTVVVWDEKPRSNDALARVGLEHWWVESTHLNSTSGQLCSFENLALSGLHNFINASFVLAASSHISGLDLQTLEANLVHFTGLPYRCQVVGKTALGEDVINDSKSTNVESTLIALSTAKGRSILLVGGAGKGESFKPVALHKNSILEVLAFGASRHQIASDLAGEFAVKSFASLRDALAEALAVAAVKRASILLSPACASFDEFKNYEDRGQKFNSWLKDMSKDRESP